MWNEGIVPRFELKVLKALSCVYNYIIHTTNLQFYIPTYSMLWPLLSIVDNKQCLNTSSHSFLLLRFIVGFLFDYNRLFYFKPPLSVSTAHNGNKSNAYLIKLKPIY